MALFISPRPRSVTGLLLASFALVALPLLIATVFGVVYVDRLAEQSQRLVMQGVNVTRNSRKLASNITDMERNARQYLVIEDAELAEAFERNHQEFLNTISSMGSLRLQAVPAGRLDELRSLSTDVAERISTSPLNKSGLEDKLAAFEQMRNIASEISDEGNRFIDHETANLTRTSRQARQFLLICVFALVPAAVLLVFLFTSLISRPIHQIRGAIRTLGEGDFEQPVAVSAPSRELDAVGTQLDWMRRRLSELESEKNQFLRQMSHELKTPLASIREGVELMRDNSLGSLNDKQTEAIEIIQQNSLELQALIENLLNFAAWRQHRSQLNCSQVDLGGLLAQVLKRHRLTLDRKQLRLTESYEPCEIFGDLEQLRLLLDNLITNAIKFSPEGGRLLLDIRTSGKPNDRRIELLVGDDGPGIPAADRDQVFNPFYQSSLPVRAHVQGTGIGLSVAREVVRAHGGEISVVDQPDVKGACFRVYLPSGSTQSSEEVS